MYPLALNVIRGCWTTFAIVWLIAALTTKRSVYRESSVRRLRYVIPLLLGCMLMFKGYRFGAPLNVRVIPRNDVIAVCSAMACFAGVAFCVWARMILGRNWSGTITLKEDHQLVTRGPYRFARHPIYTGLLAMCVGTVLIIGNLAGFIGLALIFVSLWIKLRDEEEIMLQQFPAEYPVYCQRVRRLIPFIG